MAPFFLSVDCAELRQTEDRGFSNHVISRYAVLFRKSERSSMLLSSPLFGRGVRCGRVQHRILSTSRRPFQSALSLWQIKTPVSRESGPYFFEVHRSKDLREYHAAPSSVYLRIDTHVTLDVSDGRVSLCASTCICNACSFLGYGDEDFEK